MVYPGIPEDCERCGRTTPDKVMAEIPGEPRYWWVCRSCQDATEPEVLLRPDRLIYGLTMVYLQNPVIIALLCDEYLDRSGRLLGKIRDLSAWYRENIENVS